MITTVELGKHLTRCRAARGMSLRDVAGETGVSPSTLSRIENGKGAIDTRTVSLLARYLDVPLERERRDQFIYHKGEPIPQIVDALLRNEPSLSARERDSLSEIFSAAYRVITSQK